MSIQEQVTADQAAVNAAQAALQAATDKLNADMALLASVQPQLDAIAEIEAAVTRLSSEFASEFASLIEKVKSLL